MASALEQQPCIGLFGTCGSSTFRQELFIPAYEAAGIRYYNPQVPAGMWRPEMAAEEADHLTFDVVQCWPVTGETYGTGSLAEQGYSIASSLRAESPLPKFVLPLIELSLSDDLQEEAARQESLRARKLAQAHLLQNASPNVFVMSSLEEMVEVSMRLYHAAATIVSLSKGYNPAFRRYTETRSQAEAFASAMQRGLLGREALGLYQRNVLP